MLVCGGIQRSGGAARFRRRILGGGGERRGTRGHVEHPPFLGPVTFEVRESWKGVSQERVIVHGQGGGASCGLNFDEGETYLVFAYHAGKRGEGPLETGLCTSTAPLSAVEEAPAALGSPTDQLPDTGGPEAPSLGDELTVAAVVVFAFVMLTGVILVQQQRRDQRP